MVNFINNIIKKINNNNNNNDEFKEKNGIRERLAKLFNTNARDYDALFHYIKKPSYKDYYNLYKRGDITKRIIDAYPDAIWSDEPLITENNKKLEDYEKLVKKFNLYNIFNRVDKLASLGQFSVLLIGYKDNLKLDRPLGSVNGINGISYIMPFSEEHCEIKKYNTDQNSEYFGKPIMYKLKTSGYEVSGAETKNINTSFMVHSSRILHIAEGTLENEIKGRPKLECVINRLSDLQKVIGGASELFWLNGRGGLVLEADKDIRFKSQLSDLTDEIKSFQNDLTRIIKAQGVNVKNIEHKIYDPTGHVNVITDVIAGATGIPKRILLGSERGELASSQDENNWLSRVNERKETFCSPVILRPFIDMMMNNNIIKNRENYEINWINDNYISEKDRSEIALNITKALSEYKNNDISKIIKSDDFFKILGLNLTKYK